MLNKLKELYAAANDLQPHEDKYNFNLQIIDSKQFFLTIEHEYINKTAQHPISVVYGKKFEELNDEIIQEIKKKLIDRQLSLIEIRRTEAAALLETYRRANEDFANRIVHLEKIKSL